MAVTVRDNMILLTQEGDTYPDWVKIENAVWEGATTAGHLCTLHDSNGVEVFTMTCPGENETVQLKDVGWVQGLDLDDLDSGELRLFVE